MAKIDVIAIPELSIEGKRFRVLEYELDEHLSEVGGLTCALFDDSTPLPRPGEVLDKHASFTLTRSDDSQKRTYVGTVVSAELEPDDDDVPCLRIQVAPALWQLGKRAACRIFQDKSAVDIVKEVLEGAGVAGDATEWRLTEDHAKRVYTVQYRESDLAFVHRLLAEEGIYFAIQPKDGGDVVVFADAKDGLDDIEGTATLPFVEEFGLAGSTDRIFSIEQDTAVRTDKTFVRDYDPDRPSLDVEAGAEGTDSGAHVLEAYDYPARCVDVAVATQRAKAMLESAQAERDVVHGQTGSLALSPGLRFTLDGHPYDPLNQQYLVTRSRLAGSQPRHFQTGGRESRCTLEFWGIPTGKSRYRPPRRERAQVVVGLQTAITTGAAGEEIHTDASGHVKVKFHWDRSGKTDDTSSRWIRTSQVPLGGSMLLPRVGWEVTVRHLEGDVDRPLVMGRVYNVLTPPPYALPKDCGRSSLQTATTPGGAGSNEFRMTDTKGNEEFFVNASKDMTTEVKNNVTESIGNDHKKKVGSNQAKNVTDSTTASVGSNQTITIGGNQSIKTETFMVDEIKGDHSLSVGGNRDLAVGGDHKRDVGGSSTLDVGGNEVDLVCGSVTEETLASFNHKVGAALIELAVQDRSVTVGGARSEVAGAAKVIVVKGGRGVTVGGSMNQKVAGAIVNVAKADLVAAAGGTFTEVAAGAQIVKANNVVFEAEAALTLVMGGSILSLTPASVTVVGTSVKLDGDLTDTAALILDN